MRPVAHRWSANCRLLFHNDRRRTESSVQEILKQFDVAVASKHMVSELVSFDRV